MVTNIHKNLIWPLTRYKAKKQHVPPKPGYIMPLTNMNPVCCEIQVFPVFFLKKYVSHLILRQKCQIKSTGINTVKNIFTYYLSQTLYRYTFFSPLNVGTTGPSEIRVPA
jgi:hypothetical protein